MPPRIQPNESTEKLWFLSAESRARSLFLFIDTVCSARTQSEPHSLDLSILADVTVDGGNVSTALSPYFFGTEYPSGDVDRS
jgi:hypothetical protein